MAGRRKEDAADAARKVRGRPDLLRQRERTTTGEVLLHGGLPFGGNIVRCDPDPPKDVRVGEVQDALHAGERGDQGDGVPAPQRTPLPGGVEDYIPDLRKRHVLVVCEVEPGWPSNRCEARPGAR